MGGVEYVLHGEMSVQPKTTLRTPRNQKLIYNISDTSSSSNGGGNEGPNNEQIEDSGPDLECYSSFSSVAES